MQSVAVSADGTRTLHRVPLRDHGSPAFTTRIQRWQLDDLQRPAVGRDAGVRPGDVGDFYATSGSTLYASTNGGASFSVREHLLGHRRAAPGVRQVGGSLGRRQPVCTRFTASGATKTQNRRHVAVGVRRRLLAWRRAAEVHPGRVHHRHRGRAVRLLRSDDGGGASWTRINDNAHQYGWLAGQLHRRRRERFRARLSDDRRARHPSTATEPARGPEMARRGNLANGDDSPPEGPGAPDVAPAATSRSSCRSWSRSSRPSRPTSSSSSWSSWWSSWRRQRARLRPWRRSRRPAGEQRGRGNDANEVHGSSLSLMLDGDAKMRGIDLATIFAGREPSPVSFRSPHSVLRP